MDGSRDPGSGLFNRSELPQSLGAEQAPLAPIARGDGTLEEPRARAASVPRLAVAATPSTGSGLIDLDEVARSLEKGTQALADAPAPALAAPAAGRLAAQAVPAATMAMDSEPMPVVAPQRNLLLASIALLAVVAGLLGYLALA